MSEKILNILKIAGLWALILFLLVFLTILSSENTSSLELIKEYLILMAYSIICVCAFIPTIILLYFLCKKIKNKYTKIFLISFLIPFTNLIYLCLTPIFTPGFLITIFYLGFNSLLVLIFSFIATIFTPKKWLSLKKEFLLTEFCMFWIGIILIFLVLKIPSWLIK